MEGAKMAAVGTGSTGETDRMGVRTVPFDAPWEWLAAGWRDLWAAPSVSLAYGVTAAVGAGVLLLFLLSVEAQSLFLVLAGGFMLLGPLLAVGLYDTSRRIEAGEPVSFDRALAAGVRPAGQLAFFAVLLMLAFLAWVQLAFLLLMLFMGASGLPPFSELVPTLLFTPRGLGLLIVGTAVGAVIAAIVFSASAIAVPMLLVERVDAVTAGRTSIHAVLANPKAMALWAVLVAGIMACAFATLLVGLVLAFPLVGHATWHAYVDLTGRKLPQRP
jgi:uncharacterized membrane protein